MRVSDPVVDVPCSAALPSSRGPAQEFSRATWDVIYVNADRVAMLSRIAGDALPPVDFLAGLRIVIQPGTRWVHV